MHAFPRSDQLAFLIEEPARLTQVAINATSLRFVFDNDCYVDAGLNVRYIKPNGAVVAYDKEWFIEKPIEFNTLIEQSAISVETNGLEMRIGFSNGAALLIYTDIGPYEAVAVVKRGGPEFYL